VSALPAPNTEVLNRQLPLGQLPLWFHWYIGKFKKGSGLVFGATCTAQCAFPALASRMPEGTPGAALIRQAPPAFCPYKLGQLPLFRKV
jgi:hypothetical protein